MHGYIELENTSRRQTGFWFRFKDLHLWGAEVLSSIVSLLLISLFEVTTILSKVKNTHHLNNASSSIQGSASEK